MLPSLVPVLPAGLSARAEVAKLTDNYVVIDGGALGTTCARVGCMPSKALIQVANDFHRRRKFAEQGILGASDLSVDRAKALAHVRRLRDAFVRGVRDSMKSWQYKQFISKHARFEDRQTLDLGDEKVQADRIIIATGSRPVRPKAWQPFDNYLLDTDSLFEQPTFPDRMAVLGLGPVGAEMGFALARLGVEVVAISLDKAIGGLSDPELQHYAAALTSQEMDTMFAAAEPIGPVEHGFAVAAGEREWEVDKVLLALGRAPNLVGLGLDQLGIDLDDQGRPSYDPKRSESLIPTSTSQETRAAAAPSCTKRTMRDAWLATTRRACTINASSVGCHSRSLSPIRRSLWLVAHGASCKIAVSNSSPAKPASRSKDARPSCSKPKAASISSPTADQAASRCRANSTSW
jgi:pyruvate/2-oxoglutarate dehydrogenase complex dihydrolipoamide dehydrogenase (E3) component